MNLFVDTSAFIALVDASDQYHKKAKEFVQEFQPTDHLHTTNYIIDESITKIKMALGHKKACEFGDGIFKSRIYNIHHLGQDIEHDAWNLFKQYEDKEFSFTDCTSFALMKKLGLAEAFTFDRHFEYMKFIVLP